MLTADRQVDRRILLQADSLEADGWKVTILAMPVEHANHDDDVRVQRLGQRKTSSIQKKEHLLIRVYHFVRKFIPMNGLLMRSIKRFVWTHLTNPEAFYMRLFVNAATSMPADVIVAHDLPMLPSAYAVANRHQAKLVYDSHELYAEQEFSRKECALWRSIEDKYIRDCDLRMTVNPSIAKELQQRYQIEQPLVIRNCEMLPDPLPTNSKLFHQAFSLDGSAKLILYQGGVSPNRNLKTLIQMMTYISDSSIHLVFLGDGQYKASLKKLGSKLNLQKNIHFHAAVSQSQLLDYTASADIGLIPYQGNCLNNRYCTPNKLFEFVVAGIPMIASDLPELRRMFHDYNLGMITNTASPMVFAKVVESLLGDPEKMDAYTAAVHKARLILNWQHEQQALVHAYRDLSVERFDSV